VRRLVWVGIEGHAADAADRRARGERGLRARSRALPQGRAGGTRAGPGGKLVPAGPPGESARGLPGHGRTPAGPAAARMAAVRRSCDRSRK
jgi:hypothetical protein